MGFLQGVFGQQQPQQQRQQQQPQQQVPQNPQFNPQNNGNGSGGAAQGQMNQPANSQMQGAAAGGNTANPMDDFMKLLTPSKEVQTREQQLQQQQTASLWGDVTPEKIGQSVSQMDFMQNAPQEAMQKLASGDMSALPEIINHAVRGALSNSIQMTQGMVEHGVRTGNERMSSTFDSRVRDFQVRSQTSSNPALQHPVGKSLMKTLTGQIAKSNPTMSPEEVQAKGEEFFTQFAEMVLQPKQQAEAKQRDATGVNWDEFLGPEGIQ